MSIRLITNLYLVINQSFMREEKPTRALFKTKNSYSYLCTEKSSCFGQFMLILSCYFYYCFHWKPNSRWFVSACYRYSDSTSTITYSMIASLRKERSQLLSICLHQGNYRWIHTKTLELFERWAVSCGVYIQTQRHHLAIKRSCRAFSENH